MALQIKTGDVFEVRVDEHTKRFFQFVANDATMLNSSVIRAFKKSYPKDGALDIKAIVTDSVDFYAHVFLRNGIKLGYWTKVGSIQERIDTLNVLFRDSDDYGNPDVKVSSNWHVWRINEQFVNVGKLVGTNQGAEIGVVVPPDSIVYRMKTGKYDFTYPAF